MCSTMKQMIRLFSFGYKVFIKKKKTLQFSEPSYVNDVTYIETSQAF